MPFIVVIIRLLFVVGSTYACWHLARLSYPAQMDVPQTTRIIYALVGFVVSVSIISTELLFKKKFVRTLVATVFGLIIGILVTFVLVKLTRLWAGIFIPNPQQVDQFIGPLVPVITVLTCYLSVSVVFQTKDEFRFIIPYIDLSYQGARSGGVILDTSAIIDGRVAEVLETRILNVPIIVPKFVLAELQQVADSADKMKRSRGRRGLDILNRIQRDPKINVQIHDEELEEIREVDAKLIKLAKMIEARIITTDFNLNKVAIIEGVDVINLNDLANSLKPAVLPGEPLVVKLIRQGEDPNQAVGYLDDGTMVVTENGRRSIGDKVTVIVTSVLQTSAGRMIFARVDSPNRDRNGKKT